MHFKKPDVSDLEPAHKRLFEKSKIAVVVPCFNEEKNLGVVVNTVPEYIDHIVLVDDKSTDRTLALAKEMSISNPKVVVLELSENEGVGGAIAAGYEWCRDNHMHAAVVMAGDAQMDPHELPLLLVPVLNKSANYTKGNRLLYKEAFHMIPRVRFFGNSVLSLLTKFASGYWSISDAQCGYTVADKNVLSTIDWQKMYKRYGQPNDLLISLNINDFVVKDIIMRPVYNVGEKSGIKISRVIFTISRVILKGAIKRLYWKYVVKDFHPLILFFAFGMLMLLIGFMFLAHVVFSFFGGASVPNVSLICALFSFGTAFNSLFFSMWLDMVEGRNIN